MLRARRPAAALDFAIPAINVVFLLLLFFLTAGSQSNHAEFAVEPPRTATLPLDRLPRPLLSVDRQGGLFLDGATLSEEELPERIQALRRSTPLSVLNILPEQTLPARQLLALIGRLRSDSRLEKLAVVVVTLRQPGARAEAKP